MDVGRGACECCGFSLLLLNSNTFCCVEFVMHVSVCVCCEQIDVRILLNVHLPLFANKTTHFTCSATYIPSYRQVVDTRHTSHTKPTSGPTSRAPGGPVNCFQSQTNVYTTLCILPSRGQTNTRSRAQTLLSEISI